MPAAHATRNVGAGYRLPCTGVLRGGGKGARLDAAAAVLHGSLAGGLLLRRGAETVCDLGFEVGLVASCASG
jgi:hypothetical protein